MRPRVEASFVKRLSILAFIVAGFGCAARETTSYAEVVHAIETPVSRGTTASAMERVALATRVCVIALLAEVSAEPSDAEDPDDPSGLSSEGDPYRPDVVLGESWARAASVLMTSAECVELYWYADAMFWALCYHGVDAEGTEATGGIGRSRASDYLRAFADELLCAVGRRRSQSAQAALVDVLFDRRCWFDTSIAQTITRAFLSLGVTKLPALETAPDYAKHRASVIAERIASVLPARLVSPP